MIKRFTEALSVCCKCRENRETKISPLTSSRPTSWVLMAFGTLVFPFAASSAFAGRIVNFQPIHDSQCMLSPSSFENQSVFAEFIGGDYSSFNESREDSLQSTHFQDSISKHWNTSFDKDKNFKINEEALKLIQFDFTSSPEVIAPPKTAKMDKPWMDFQIDLTVPKNMLDTARVRKPNGYIRMLPYSIWTRFGEDPVFDVLVFGNKKRLEVQWNLNLDLDDEEYGHNLTPPAGRVYQTAPGGGSSVVIENLDIIGFLYNNLNKHGRTLKRNRKRAKAWRTYQSYKPTQSDSLRFPTFYLSTSKNEQMDSCARATKPLYEFTGIDYRPHTIRLLDPPESQSQPDYNLLQTPEQRTRFGTFTLLNPFEAHPDSVSNALKKDSLSAINQEKDTQQQLETSHSENTAKEKASSKKRKHNKKHKLLKAKSKKEDKGLEELPDSMDDLYKYIRMKQEQDSIQRKKMFKKDKVSTDVYETEKQLRRLKERQE